MMAQMGEGAGAGAGVQKKEYDPEQVKEYEKHYEK